MSVSSVRLNTPTRALLLMLALAWLAGCDVGDGNTVRAVRIEGTEPNTPVTAFQCFYSQLTLTSVFEDGGLENSTLRATWTSSNPSILRVSNGDEITPAGFTLSKGTLSPVALGGPVTITASFLGFSASAQVNVAPGRLEITPARAEIAEGTRIQLFATGVLGAPGSQTLLDASQLVDWSSSDEDVATVDANGVLAAEPNNGQAAGSQIPLSIGATTDMTGCGAGTGGTTAAGVTVHNEVLDRLLLTPSGFALAPGTSRALQVTGEFCPAGSPGCGTPSFSQDLTALASYESVDPDPDDTEPPLAVFGLRGRNVILAGTIAGTANLEAEFDQGKGGEDNPQPVTGTATVNVSSATLTSLTIAPLAARMLSGTSLDYSASGGFSDSSTQDLTSDVLWDTDPLNVDIGGISNLAGSQGRFFAAEDAVGSLSVRATRTDFNGGVPVSTTVTTGAALASLAIGGSNSVAAGATTQLSATGNLTGGGAQPLTRDVIWSSSNPALAAVSNAAGFNGQVTGLAPGTVQITARRGDVSAVFSLTVN